jgi:fumarate hydratase class II
MNVNEVVAHIVKKNHPDVDIHPNDHVNMSQSSNDTFPSAMNMAAVVMIHETLIPAIDNLVATFKGLEEENKDIIKIGRTHLQDAVPLRFSQEISGWRGMLEESKQQIIESSDKLRKLAIGGTAVGTGLNCPEGFDKLCCEEITKLTKEVFIPSENKFHALTSKDGYVYTSGALKGLAANLMKIANDIRWLANGPRCGLGEITIPENEPGSSIMPGKVNPTQCEAITMIAIQVMGNDTTIGIGASQGNFELNVFMPVLAYNMIQSIRLLSDGMNSFNKNCVSGIKAKKEKMESNLYNSLMLVTCLSPVIGYENAAHCAHKAYEEDKTLKEAVLELGFLTEEEYDKTVRPEKMV